MLSSPILKYDTKQCSPSPPSLLLIHSQAKQTKQQVVSVIVMFTLSIASLLQCLHVEQLQAGNTSIWEAVKRKKYTHMCSLLGTEPIEPIHNTGVKYF